MYNNSANTLFIGKSLIYLPSCHSTNEVALLMKDEPHVYEGTVIVTADQTNGKGQMGNRWESEPGKNLTFSTILRPRFLAVSDQFYLNIVTSLAVFDFFSTHLGKNVRIKWPNDIYYLGIKVSGILIQNVLKGETMEYSVAGVGMNINQQVFDTAGAGSVKSITGRETDLSAVLSAFCEAFEKYYIMLREGQVALLLECYLDKLYLKDQKHFFVADNLQFEGIIRGIDRHGKLLIETVTGMRYFSFKEVQYTK